MAEDAPASGRGPTRILGRYELHGALASGGMATVHLGRLLGPVGFSRTVAIKRLHSQFARDPEFVSMFLDEARLAAKIRHPNVIPTLDVVATADELFLVMEYAHGESLARLLRVASEKGIRPPLPIVSAILSQVLQGLHAAHEACDDLGAPLGIIHRDVSPQNILVGSDGVTRVLDFGVAKANSRVHETRSGEIKGKLSYMAPEQIRGGGVKLTRTVDIYAAGIVLWEALTCRRLFKAETDAETMYLVLTSSPPTIESVEPSVPAALDAVAMRALARDPKSRFATAEDMAIALAAAGPMASQIEVAKWVRAIAKESITQQAARVAEIERSSSLHGGSHEVDQLMARLRASGKSNEEIEVILESGRPPPPESLSQVTRTDAGIAVLPKPVAAADKTPPKQRNMAVGASLLLALAFAIATVVFAIRPSVRVSGVADPATSSTVSPSTASFAPSSTRPPDVAPPSSLTASLTAAAAPPPPPSTTTSARAPRVQPPSTASPVRADPSTKRAPNVYNHM